MLKYIHILLFQLSLFASFSQDTTLISSDSSVYWVFQKDSIIKQSGHFEYVFFPCWTRSEYINDTLFLEEQLALNKFNPIGTYKGYFPDGSPAFERNYHFDGQYSELHGVKKLYNSNGTLKEIGHYHHGIKCGVWMYYDDDGYLIRRTEYYIPEMDTVFNSKYQNPPEESISNDTVTSGADSSFTDTFPCIDYGKTGIETLYKNGKPILVRKYDRGELILTEDRKYKMKKIIKSAPVVTHIVLY